MALCVGAETCIGVLKVQRATKLRHQPRRRKVDIRRFRAPPNERKEGQRNLVSSPFVQAVRFDKFSLYLP